MNYPDIGCQVTYIRRKQQVNELGEATGQPEIETGEGMLISIHMDHTKRLMGTIKVNDQTFNTDFSLINPDGTMLEKFTSLCERIDAIVEAANAEQRRVAEGANKAIDDETSAILGPPVDLGKNLH